MRSKMSWTLRRRLNATGEMLCEICDEKTYLQEHHIRGRKIHNPNHRSNICNICSNCHTLIHRGKIVIEDRLMTTKGYQLIWHYEDDESFTGNDAAVYIV